MSENKISNFLHVPGNTSQIRFGPFYTNDITDLYFKTKRKSYKAKANAIKVKSLLFNPCPVESRARPLSHNQSIPTRITKFYELPLKR